MASRSKEIDAWVARLSAVTEADWAALRVAFPSNAIRTLRQAVRRSGLPLDPLVEGVCQDSYDSLARTLCALQWEYEATEDRERRKAIRSVVIEAKTHAKFAGKPVMAEWMLVWLTDPKLFDAWVRIAIRSVPRTNGGSR